MRFNLSSKSKEKCVRVFGHKICWTNIFVLCLPAIILACVSQLVWDGVTVFTQNRRAAQAGEHLIDIATGDEIKMTSLFCYDPEGALWDTHPIGDPYTGVLSRYDGASLYPTKTKDVWVNENHEFFVLHSAVWHDSQGQSFVATPRGPRPL